LLGVLLTESIFSEAALAAMMPYESELNICDYVIEYLEGSLPKKQDAGGKKNNRQKKQVMLEFTIASVVYIFNNELLSSL